MCLCQEIAGARLKEIAEHFMRSHIGSVSFTTHQVGKRKRTEGRLSRLVDEVMESIVKQAN